LTGKQFQGPAGRAEGGPRHELARVLGVPGLFAIGYGNVGSSIYYALGVTSMFALGATPIVLMLGGIFFAFTAITYAEGTALIPEAGGSSSFARRAFNEFLSFFAAWALLLDFIVTISISAFTASSYLGYFMPVLRTYPANAYFGIGVVVFLMLLNIRGVKETSTLNVGLAMLDIVTQLALIALGMVLLFNLPVLIHQIKFGTAPTWHQFFYSLSIAMIAYTGIESVSNMAEEAKQPEKTVPRAITLTVVVVLFMYAGLSGIALSAMPVHFDPATGKYVTELATRWLNDPIAGMVSHLPPLEAHILAPWIAILGTSILVIATNAGILGASRLTFSMGIHRQVPAIMHRVHPKFHTPYVAIIFFCLLAIVLIIPGSIEQMADVYAYGALLSFTIAHMSIIALRVREPDAHRPFRSPLNVRIKGYQIPMTAVLGGIWTFFVWTIVAFTHPIGRVVGTAWVVFGVLMYIIYRRAVGLPLNKTERSEMQ